MSQIGYFGVLIPEYNFWQGVYLDDAAAEVGDQFLANARLAKQQFPESGRVDRPAPGVKPEDQTIFGSLCAVMVHGALKSAELQVGGAAWAIYKMTGHKFFLVRGKRVSTGGFETQYEQMPFFVTNADTARDFINSRPEVGIMKVHTLKEAEDLVRKGPRKQH